MRFVTVLAVGLGVAALMGAVGAIPATGGPGGAHVGEPAPEITGGPWINSEPLSMDKLRGRVVYVEFWTYG